ncbi:MAG: hypothetical protein Q8R12_03585 [bacterium]|nr:hypothetical protein [bacterium]
MTDLNWDTPGDRKLECQKHGGYIRNIMESEQGCPLCLKEKEEGGQIKRG